MKDQGNGKALNTGLWVVQGLLAAAIGLAGFMKLSAPIDQLAGIGMGFVNDYSAETVRFIGLCEVLAALGLILPRALRILPVLTPIAAVGVALLMVLAAGYHVTHDEPFVPTIVLGGLALFVAWGRMKKA